MATLSVVVPVYKVQPYLRECLDSILGQSFGDLELIAVDDRSPDRCGEILDEYAARDPRVRVLHLPENVGLGRARNAGLAAASGDYVWFVDSDDWIAPGAMQAIADRIRATEPDVLMIEYARTYWTGEQRRNMLSAVFADETAPPVFRLVDRPVLLDLFPSAWSKVVRRQFLIDADLPFPTGWYEDLPFTYPLLALADRISMLGMVCYFYRQRRGGGILSTSGERHVEVLEQYERVFHRLDRWAERTELVRSRIFGKAVQHGLLILRSRTRMPKPARAAFFHRLAAFYRAYLPPSSYPKPRGAELLRQGLVARDAWRTYAMLRASRLVAGRTRQAITLLVRGARGGADDELPGSIGPVTAPAVTRKPAALAVLRRRLRRMASAPYYWLQRRLPLDPALAVYSVYWGRGYGCNPAAIYEKARELAPHVRGVWVVRRDRVAQIPPGVPYVVAGSPDYFRVMARGTWFFNNVNFSDRIVKRPGSVHVQTHHGTPLKIMGVDQLRFPRGAQGMNFGKLVKRCDRWDFSISSNAFSSEVWGRAYPCRFEMLEYGYPRNDLVCTATPEQIEQIRAGLGLDRSNLVVLYAPTHRDLSPDYQSLLDPGELARTIGPRARILVRAHHTYDRANGGPVAEPQVIDVSGFRRVEQLYLAADILVTDYSSVMFDYALLDRPIVIYAPDWDDYREIRGVYFDLLAEPPGAVATTQAALLDAFRSGAVWDDAATKARAEFRRRFCHIDDGRAAERVVRRVILGEAVDF